MSRVGDRSRSRWQRRVAFAGLVALAAMLAAPAGFAVPPASSPASAPAPTGGARADTVERHPLELRALSEPEGVLAELGPALRDAHIAGDPHELARLYLAKANACRVMADWDCQRQAGEQAGAAAASAGLPLLQVRGLIAEARARMALQDYTRSDRLLGEAEQLLKATPQPELLADVMLAYSSMSFSLGKHALAAQYAERGLALLGPGEGVTMQARLQRNRARALAQLGRAREAARALELATTLAEQLNDPKLVAELYLEAARLARLAEDVPTQRVYGERILTLANQLKNSQLDGLGHEVMGLAAIDNDEQALAMRELQAAQASFRELDLGTDELRVLREMVQYLLRTDPASPLLQPMFERFLMLDTSQAQNERSQASGDFDARLRYAERETEVLRLQSEGELAAQRERALAERNRLSVAVSLLAFGMLAALAGFFLLQRRGNRRLREALARLGERELQYRTLAENSSDLVVRMRPDGRRLYVSPSARDLLGYEPEELAEPRWELVHADDRERLAESLAEVIRDGGPLTVAYRLLHRKGHHVWIEALARRVTGVDGEPEVVYSGRDVSARMRIERALAATQAQLRAVADNIPAMIARIDSQQRYTFVNGFSSTIFAEGEGDTLGRTVRDVRGESIYSEIRPHIEAALRGERVSFEGQAKVGDRQFDYQTNYVPDLGADGRVHGFFSFTFDITRLKEAERELERQARVDGLTALANRRHFDERLAGASARSRRAGQPLALLYLDVDHFKDINDGHGHAAGDAVLREYAHRLKANVREGDLVARIGGDEFVVLIEGAESVAAVEAVAAKLVQALHEPVALAGGPRVVGTSVGVGFSLAAASGEQLLAAADQALYSAKDAGRGCWRSIVIA
jgi:diguanylate cyclase (GGDEF)-like protein/PAS domain S-box-containing protein